MKELIPALAGVPTIYWSSPGQGKTSKIEAAFNKLGYHLETLVLSQCDPADIGGLPYISNGETLYAKPDWLQRIESAPKSVLFFDELTTARPSVQAPALTLIQSRKIHSLKLPDSTLIIAASNPPEQAADGSDLEPPMANRFCHLDWKYDLNSWADGLISDFTISSYFDLPEGWRALIQKERIFVASFLKSNPFLANKMPESSESRGGAWPSFRTWTNAATVIAAANSVNEDFTDFLCGCVGSGAGIEYLNWRKNLDLPNPEEVLKKIDSFLGWAPPKRDDISLVTVSSVVSAIKNNNTKERWNLGWKVLEKVASCGKPDISIIGARMLRECGQDYGLPENWERVKSFAAQINV